MCGSADSTLADLPTSHFCGRADITLTDVPTSHPGTYSSQRALRASADIAVFRGDAHTASHCLRKTVEVSALPIRRSSLKRRELIIEASTPPVRWALISVMSGRLPKDEEGASCEEKE